MRAFEYVTAENFGAATAYLAENPPEKTVVKAGGIDVVDRLKERIDTPRTVLNLRTIRPDAGYVEQRQREGVLAVHALTTLADVSEHELLRRHFPGVAQACAEAATPQVRNSATIGGNLCQKPRCWFYRSSDYHCLKKGGNTCYAVEGDNRYHAILGAGACHIVHPSNAAVPLLAANASVRCVRHEGGQMQERVIPLDEFFRVPPNPEHDENVLEEGELIREILIPMEYAGPRASYIEARHKRSFDWPLVSCAVNWNKAEQPRVVLGAVAPIPWRLKKVEQALGGQALSDTLLAHVKQLSTRGADPMSENAYKLKLAPAVLEDALKQATA